MSPIPSCTESTGGDWPHRVGGPDEPNPLLYFQYIDAFLLDSSTIALSDHAAVGRLVVVDLLSGEGWDVGPVEFGNEQPWVFALDDTVHAFTTEGLHYTYLRDGTLLARKTSEHERGGVAQRAVFPKGVMSGGRLASYWFGRGDESGPEYQRVEHGMLIGDEEIPFDSAIAHVRGTQTGLSGYASAARGDLVAYWDPMRSALTIFHEGTRTDVRLDREVEHVRIDADGRLWARLHRVYPRARDQAWLVLDRRGREVMRVKTSSVVDARGDWLLTSEWHDAAFEAVLYRRVR